MVAVLLDAAADRPDARENLAHVDRLAHHVVDAGGEELERLLEPRALVHGDHRSPRAAADHARKRLPLLAVAEQEGLDGREVALRRCLHPFTELARTEAGGGDPLALKPRRVAFGHDVPIVDDDEHRLPPKTPFPTDPHPRITCPSDLSRIASSRSIFYFGLRSFTQFCVKWMRIYNGIAAAIDW